MTDYAKLTDAEIDVLVATEVMGWRLERDSQFTFLRRPDGGGVDPPCFRPATDYNDAAVMRAEIEWKGLQKKMCKAMNWILSSLDIPHDYGDVVDYLIRHVETNITATQVRDMHHWALLNASPRQQCIAALQAVRSGK